MYGVVKNVFWCICAYFQTTRNIGSKMMLFNTKTRFSPLYTLKMQMRKNTFKTTPYIKKYFLKNLILVVWKYAQMHQSTFFTTPYIKKYRFKELDSGCL